MQRPTSPAGFATWSAEMDLDNLDLAIIGHLQEDGRRSFTDIAKALGVTSATVKNRYDRLIESETISVAAMVDPTRVGFHAPAFLSIRLKAEHFEEAIAAFIDFPEIDQVVIVSGERNVELTVSCMDYKHFVDFAHVQLPKVEGVVDIHTKMVLDVRKLRQTNVMKALPSILSTSAEAAE